MVTGISKKELIKSACKSIEAEGAYIKAIYVKNELFFNYNQTVSMSYCQRVLSRLSDIGFLKCVSAANMNGEKLYEIKEIKENEN